MRDWLLGGKVLSPGTLKKVAKLLLPPILTEGLRLVLHGRTRPTLEYTPDGWRTQIDKRQTTGWNVESVVHAKRAEWEAFCRQCQDTRPFARTEGVSTHNIYMTYAYVLALTAHQKSYISVLDWGGLGHYYLIGKLALPDVMLDFHCKEVPLMAEMGKLLNPEVHWYIDESCLKRSYDLVMISGSLQCIEDWEGTLRRVARTAQGYLFLTRLPVVKGPSFVAIQRSYNAEMMHWQLNQDAVLQVVKSAGLRLIREFVVGDRPYIQDAPEQCELRGWLFKRE